MSGAVGVIGLGAMGLGMARSLKRAGFDVVGTDPDPERQALARDAGVAVASDAVAAPIVVGSLPTAAHVEAVVTGADGFLARGAAGAVFVDTSTSEAAVSQALEAACAEAGKGFLDAPVSGGPAGAEGGALTMMIGGASEHLQTARPALDAMAADGRIFHVGGPGAGNVAKLVNNLLVAAHLLTAREAVSLSEAAGVPAQDVLAVVNAASGRSAVTEVNLPRWILSGAFDSGFTMGLMRKDVRLAKALADSVDADLPVSALVAQLWAASAQDLADGEDFNRIAAPTPHEE